MKRRQLDVNDQPRPTGSPRERLLKAQESVRQHISPEASLVDEFIADRRNAARQE